MGLRIRIYGDPVLRTPARRVTSFDAELRDFAEAMIATMHQADGIGLAAQQVGDTRAILVLDVPAELDHDDAGNPMNPGLEMPCVMVNPEIVGQSRSKSRREEGCLSLPGIRAEIERPSVVTVRWQNLQGQAREMTLRGLVARAVQHEVDHLHGVLITDRMSAAKRFALRNALRELRKQYESTLHGVPAS